MKEFGHSPIDLLSADLIAGMLFGRFQNDGLAAGDSAKLPLPSPRNLPHPRRPIAIKRPIFDAEFRTVSSLMLYAQASPLSIWQLWNYGALVPVPSSFLNDLLHGAA
ncbi:MULTISPECIES: hypothetical protein [Sphingobium]|uniref:hypothetical protein n=1 Tax=Sphingobium TaxID=165695 RepID=UPI00159C0FBA|nr:hypothetical protein [Sphingobium sp. 15-1]